MYKNKIKMEIAPEILIQAVMNMKKKERESFLEDLLASTSPDYLESIKESREDYKAGRVKSHDEIFDKWCIVLYIPAELSETLKNCLLISKDVSGKRFFAISRPLMIIPKPLQTPNSAHIDSE
jgi:hypothetical protein